MVVMLNASSARVILPCSILARSRTSSTMRRSCLPHVSVVFSSSWCRLPSSSESSIRKEVDASIPLSGLRISWHRKLMVLVLDAAAASAASFTASAFSSARRRLTSCAKKRQLWSCMSAVLGLRTVSSTSTDLPDIFVFIVSCRSLSGTSPLSMSRRPASSRSSSELSVARRRGAPVLASDAKTERIRSFPCTSPASTPVTRSIALFHSDTRMELSTANTGDATLSST
mmetsp:Transcript_27395/g.93506  ORF Transcript_27395/g.93506 Transcript_27395/m.93506 type:complete len:228 (+) Transcript_27395:3631-4314(+)